MSHSLPIKSADEWRGVPQGPPAVDRIGSPFTNIIHPPHMFSVWISKALPDEGFVRADALGVSGFERTGERLRLASML